MSTDRFTLHSFTNELGASQATEISIRQSLNFQVYFSKEEEPAK